MPVQIKSDSKEMKVVNPNFTKCNLDLNLALGSTSYITSGCRGIMC